MKCRLANNDLISNVECSGASYSTCRCAIVYRLITRLVITILHGSYFWRWSRKRLVRIKRSKFCNFWLYFSGFTFQGRRFTYVTKIRMQKNIGNLTTLLEPHNIGTHLKGIETSFQVVPLFLRSVHVRVSYITFWNSLKVPSVFKGLNFKDSFFEKNDRQIMVKKSWLTRPYRLHKQSFQCTQYAHFNDCTNRR
jgi:hypothetical protein